MLRRVLATVAITIIGLFAAGTAAFAAPTPTPTPAPYPPPHDIAVSVSSTTVVLGNTVVFSGTGFLPNEGISISVSYQAPSGLRANRALAAARLAAAALQSTRADSRGSFATDVHLIHSGMASLTAVGQTSGRTGTLNVLVLTSGTPTTTNPTSTSPTTTETAPGGESSSTSEPTTTYITTTVEESETTSSQGTEAPVENGGSGGSGLASTGVSIAGPLTIGASALMVGLALLFFGARTVIRRKNTST